MRWRIRRYLNEPHAEVFHSSIVYAIINENSRHWIDPIFIKKFTKEFASSQLVFVSLERL